MEQPRETWVEETPQTEEKPTRTQGKCRRTKKPQKLQRPFAVTINSLRGCRFDALLTQSFSHLKVYLQVTYYSRSPSLI